MAWASRNVMAKATTAVSFKKETGKNISLPFFEKCGFIFKKLQAASANEISAQSLFNEKAISVINRNLFLTQQ